MRKMNDEQVERFVADKLRHLAVPNATGRRQSSKKSSPDCSAMFRNGASCRRKKSWQPTLGLAVREIIAKVELGARIA